MPQPSHHGSHEVVEHLLVLQQMRDKTKSIHLKIAEVTARLEVAQRAIEFAPGSPSHQSPQNGGNGHAQSALSALKELDAMLGQPDLTTREELRSHLQELIVKLEEPGSD